MKQKLWQLQSVLAPYLFVAPFVILFLCFGIYPLCRSFALSFYKTIGPRESRFVGMENYHFLLKDKLFWLAALNTVAYAIGFLLLQIPVALTLAIVLNSPRVRARSFFRFAFFSTHLVGSIFVSVLFSQLLSPRIGLLNRFLSLFAHDRVEINWLSKPLLTIPSLLMAGLWLSAGHAMIYFLAALQGVDRELYEAAEVDGAGNWKKFWHITLPGIRPVLSFMLLVGTIGSLQLFETPYVLYGQSTGPANSALTIVMYLFMSGFSVGDLGYAAAVGWVLVLLILVFSIIQLRLSRKGDQS